MRNQFYADRKDVLKWTVTLNAAHPDKTVLFVPMLRPDAGEHGNDFAPVPGARPEVQQFFENERRLIGAGIVPRQVMRTGLLSPRITTLPTPFAWGNRAAYFDEVVTSLNRRPPAERSVVLLDPDNGIAEPCDGERRHTRVCPDQLQTTWRSMRPGDVLVIYQTPWYINAGDGRFDPPRNLLANAIGIAHDAIQLHAYGDVGFFQALRV